MENRRFQVFREGERKRRNTERYRDATSLAAGPRSVRPGAAAERFRNLFRRSHCATTKRQFEIRSSARTRLRLVAEIDGAQATSYKSFTVMGNPFDEARRIRRKLQDQEIVVRAPAARHSRSSSRRTPGPITTGSSLATTRRSVRLPSATERFRGMGPGVRRDDGLRERIP